MLQETNLRKTEKFSIKNYTTHRKKLDDMKRAHDVTLSVKNDIMHPHIPLQTHLQALVTSKTN